MLPHSRAPSTYELHAGSLSLSSQTRLTSARGMLQHVLDLALLLPTAVKL